LRQRERKLVRFVHDMRTGSDKRYFSDEMKALYRSAYVEKLTLLIQLKYRDLIKVYILGISSDIK
jgi:hypothetical protein